MGRGGAAAFPAGSCAGGALNKAAIRQRWSDPPVWAALALAGRDTEPPARRKAMKFHDTELKIMEVLWREGDVPARHIAEVVGAQTGWNVNTTYTMLKRMIAKGAIERRDPRFICHALVTRKEAQAAEADDLIDRLFDGSADKLFAFLLGRKRLTQEQLRRLRAMIEEDE